MPVMAAGPQHMQIGDVPPPGFDWRAHLAFGHGRRRGRSPHNGRHRLCVNEWTLINLNSVAINLRGKTSLFSDLRIFFILPQFDSEGLER